MAELDLEKGDAVRAERITLSKESSSGEKKPLGGSQGSSRKSGSTARERGENELTVRVQAVFIKIADMLQRKGDDELEEAVRDNAPAMSQGFVSLTRNIRWLRSPLLLFLNLVEPALAFWDVGTILVARWYARRTAQTPVTPEPQGQEVPVGG